MANEELSPGTTLSSRYRIGVVLGRGAMGVVYDATRLLDGARVAVKVLNDQTRANPSAMQRFEREAQAASRLGHPGIVKIFDFQKEPHEPAYLVMEFLEGHSLGREIEVAGPLPLPRIARIASDLLTALSAAHRAGLVHRDIKPDNIVLLTGENPPFSCKLVDFGVVKVAGQVLTQAGQVIGTPAYMSPEQWQGAAVDPRSDIYALGGCLYHAIMGRTAVTSVEEAVQPGFCAQRARAMPQENLAVTQALAEVLAKALEPFPSSRFASADEMSVALGRAMSRTVVTNPPPASAARAPPSYAPAYATPPPPHRPSMPSYGSPLAASSYGPAGAVPSYAPAGAVPSYGPAGTIQSHGPPQNAFPPTGPPQVAVPWWRGSMARNALLAAFLLAFAAWILPRSCLPF